MTVLPLELVYRILDCASREDLQAVALALTRVLPNAIPARYLFECPRLKNTEQVFQFYKKVRGSGALSKLVHDFTLVTWTVDADIVVNAMGVLPTLQRLELFIGPNFSPEHLEEVFQTPRSSLRLLSLRFRPYMQRATYYQFLKGAYFDSTVATISKHPPGEIRHLSIVQDPFEGTRTDKHFAQPLVFFRLDPISELMQSVTGVNLTHFRLRVPMRQVAATLSPRMQSPSIPRIAFLDLSTCKVFPNDISALTEHYSRLEHLILDDCEFLQAHGEGREGEWAALGKVCALAGLRRAKERERKAKAWLDEEAAKAAAEALSVAEMQSEGAIVEEVAQPRSQRRGRRGLATATISLRDPPAHDTRRSTASRLPPGMLSKVTASSKLRLWPPSPTLRSISIHAHHTDADRQEVLREEFRRGWSEGLEQLVAVRKRLRQSSANGYRIMGILPLSDPCSQDDPDQGLNGLEDMDTQEKDPLPLDTTGHWPVLCLAGPGKDAVHQAHCGHSIGWTVWDDYL